MVKVHKEMEFVIYVKYKPLPLKIAISIVNNVLHIVLVLVDMEK